MNRKTQYMTRQREQLIEFLLAVPGKHITVNDVCEHFRNNGDEIGQTTVYRQLDKLVDEGVVNKYTLDGVGPACFEYVGKDSHVAKNSCFHCKCVRCGRLIHLQCSELDGIQRHLYEHHGFSLNPMRTVFYGLCSDCAERE
ncbi:MAG: transcriptional repressor [Clostridia bacterium]|nr:transcriptional repressor [Clostridia bacterium]